MAVIARVYYNGDDCFLAWTYPQTKNCWGFAIQKDCATKDGQHSVRLLENRTGFAGDQNGTNEHQPSDVWPFQRYTWTDHSVTDGDTVTYTLWPVMNTPGGLQKDDAQTVTVGPITLTCNGAGRASAYFNRGLLLSQFVSRALGPDWNKKTLVQLKKDLAKQENGLRLFLSGPLRERLLSLLNTAQADGSHVYLAIYELDDDELISALAALKKRAHVILSNGSKKKKGEDGNKTAADELDGVVDLHRRMLWSEGLAHNKFLVIAKPKNQVGLVWTGSTNWATTALCTQLNNGIIVDDPKVAQEYLDQWFLLRDDKRAGKNNSPMHFGTTLMESNDEAKNGIGKKTGNWSVWFTRTSDGRDLDAATELINGAKEAILFLMFEPGSAGLLPVIQARLSPASKTYNESLYIHGVVNTLNPNGKDVDVQVVSRGTNDPFSLKIVQPQGIKRALGAWAAEVTRNDFILGQGGVIGHAIVHSKVIVIDPFTNPIVITGSHNFSTSASTKNDENLLVIQGNKGLAERYIVHIMGVYQHYRWRSYLQECDQKGISPWDGLQKNDQWQKRDSANDPELHFWVR